MIASAESAGRVAGGIVADVCLIAFVIWLVVKGKQRERQGAPGATWRYVVAAALALAFVSSLVR